jgi:hypothetical protein
MIDKIVGIIFLPLSIILFLNIFGITDIQTVIGIDIIMIAAISLIIIQAANIIGAHHAQEHVHTSWILCTIMIFPSILYFLSLTTTMPETLMTSFPGIFAGVILVEGVYGFYW